MFGSIGNAFKKATGGLGGVVNPAGLLDSDNFMSVLPGIGDSMAAEKQNAANISAADRAMKFSERMSSTAYQRAMSDMKAAGLNPMLAFSQGGASAPSGVTPTINSTTKSGFGSAAISAGLGIQAASTAKQQADTQQASAESSIALNKATAAKQVADTAQATAKTDQIRTQTAIERRKQPRAEAQERLEKGALDIVDKLINSIGSDAKSTKAARDLVKDSSSKPSIFEPTGNSLFDWLTNRKPKGKK